MDPVTRTLARWMAAPPLWMGRQLHRWATGAQAVLEAPVGPIADLAERQAWLLRLGRVAADPHVAAVVLRIDGPLGGWAAHEDLRGVVGELRRAGKTVVAQLQTPGNASLWVAAACTRSVIVPTGEVALVGIGAELTFFGALLERLGVQPDFEAAGAYKSFGEPWTRRYASPANLEATRTLVDSLHERLVADLAHDRSLSREQVFACIERAPLSAADAVASGLVDQLAYPDQLQESLLEPFGADDPVPFAAWARRDLLLERLSRAGGPSERVVVLHLDGPIGMDAGSSGMGAVAVIPHLSDLREDSSVAGVVLHVSSPGGSAIASDRMWREVDLLRRAKPVVACFEDVAASGGYYLSAPAQHIIARRTTLTGSIGVFGGKLVMADGLRQAGVHHQQVLAGPNAAMFSASAPFNPGQRARFRESLQRFYDGFVERVASGRGQSEEDIEPHCRGRVWTGELAKERGLVDRFGGVPEAVAQVRELAACPRAQRVDRSFRPPWQGLFRQGLRRVLPAAAVAPVSGAMWMAAHAGEPLAMWPFELKVR